MYSIYIHIYIYIYTYIYISCLFTCCRREGHIGLILGPLNPLKGNSENAYHLKMINSFDISPTERSMAARSVATCLCLISCIV